MKKYELFFVLPGTLDDNQATKRADEVLGMVKEFSTDPELKALGKNRLAYPVQQIRYGYYFTLVFSALPAAVKEFQAKLAITSDLLRKIVSHFNPKATAPARLVYNTNDMGVTTMSTTPTPEAAATKEVVVEAAPAPVAPVEIATEETPVLVEVEKPVEKPVKKPAEKLDMKDIEKKLDEILDGNVISGI